MTGDKRLAVEPLNKAAVISSQAQVMLVTDTNSLPEQWAASIIAGRNKLLELLDKHPGPVFIKIGKQARDHVNVKEAQLGLKKDEKAENTSAGALTANAQQSGDSEPNAAGAETAQKDENPASVAPTAEPD